MAWVSCVVTQLHTYMLPTDLSSSKDCSVWLRAVTIWTIIMSLLTIPFSATVKQKVIAHRIFRMSPGSRKSDDAHMQKYKVRASIQSRLGYMISDRFLSPSPITNRSVNLQSFSRGHSSSTMASIDPQCYSITNLSFVS